MKRSRSVKIDDPIFVAARTGDLNALKRKRNLYVNICGHCVLHEAVRNNQVACVSYLLEKQPDLTTAENNWNETPLFEAIRDERDIEIVRMLVKFKDTVNSVNENMITPLQLAAKAVKENLSPHYSVEVTQLLLENGAETEDEYTQCNYSALHIAIEYRNVGVVKVLLEHKASILCCSDDWHKDSDHTYDAGEGMTALMHAAYSGSNEIVKLILEAGANPVAQMSDGKTALELACDKFNCDHKIEAIKTLLEFEAVRNQELYKNLPYDRHPLANALYNKSPEVLQELLNAGFKELPTLLVGIHLYTTSLWDLLNENKASCKVEMGAISYLLFNIRFSQNGNIAKCLEILLNAGYPIQCENRNFPPILSVLSHSRHDNCDDIMMELVHKLIELDPDAVKSQFFTPTSSTIRTVVGDVGLTLRQLLSLPDALLIAFIKRCKPAVEFLLSYWKQPPITLLLFDPKITQEDLDVWFPFLAKLALSSNIKPNKLKILPAPEIDPLTMAILEDRLMNAGEQQTVAKLSLAKLYAQIVMMPDCSLPRNFRYLDIPVHVKSLIFPEMDQFPCLSTITQEHDYFMQRLGVGYLDS